MGCCENVGEGRERSLSLSCLEISIVSPELPDTDLLMDVPGIRAREIIERHEPGPGNG